MGAKLLMAIKNGNWTDIKVPHSDIHYIPDMVREIANELAVDTFIDLSICMYLHTTTSSKVEVLGVGCSLGDYTHDREHDKYTVELEDDGSIGLYCNGIRVTARNNHRGDLWYHYVGLYCENYNGLLTAIELIFDCLFDDISEETVIFIRKYRIYAIQIIAKELLNSPVFIGFQSDDFYKYRTGDMNTDIMNSAVDKVLSTFI